MSGAWSLWAGPVGRDVRIQTVSGTTIKVSKGPYLTAAAPSQSSLKDTGKLGGCSSRQDTGTLPDSFLCNVISLVAFAHTPNHPVACPADLCLPSPLSSLLCALLGRVCLQSFAHVLCSDSCSYLLFPKLLSMIGS